MFPLGCATSKWEKASTPLLPRHFLKKGRKLYHFTYIFHFLLCRLVCSSVTRIRHEKHENAHHQRNLLKEIGRRSAAISNHRQEEKKILDKILEPEVYDNRMRPTGVNSTDGPTIVNVNLYFRSFEKIDDVKMVSCTLRKNAIILEKSRVVHNCIVEI